MTTLAYDGNTIVIDSQCTQGCMKTTTSKTKLIGQDRLFFIGSLDIREDLVKYYKSEFNKDLKPSGEYTLVILKPPGIVYEINELSNTPMQIKAPYVAGSGSHFAMAALHLEQEAINAVDLACSLDIYSSGPLEVFNVKES